MAFVNPNILSVGISREEFEELKNRVDLIDSKLDKIVILNGNLSNNLEETIINSSSEFNEISNAYEAREDINVRSAKLSGIPRIEYFNFNKKKEVEEEKDDSNLNIINLSDILNSKKENRTYAYKTENIPVVAKTSSGHRTTLMNENKISNLKNRYYGDVKKIAA